jgi:hypothetical protein
LLQAIGLHFHSLAHNIEGLPLSRTTCLFFTPMESPRLALRAKCSSEMGFSPSSKALPMNLHEWLSA